MITRADFSSRIRPRFLTQLLRRPQPAKEELLAGPLRGELLGTEHLAERARAIAREQKLTPARRRRRGTPLLRRLDETRTILEEAHARIAEGAERGLDVGPAGAWLLDNFHVVQEHIREVSEGLPRGYYRQLPELASGLLGGYPRVYELAIALISHTEARIDAGNIELFLSAFQEVRKLTIGELWAVPAMLRLGLLESVRRMALRTVQRLDQVEEADRMAARIHDAGAREGALEAELREFAEHLPRVTSAFAMRFLHRLREYRGSIPGISELEERIGWSADEAERIATQRLALTQVMMANSITSLRVIGRLDWKKLVERQSVLERVLLEDPAGTYARMTFATRDNYRHVVEGIALRTSLDEADVARLAINKARHNGADVRRTHVGYFLIDDGVRELEREVGYRPKPGELLYRWVTRHPNLVFGGGVLLGTAIAIAAALWLTGPAARSAWLLAAVLLFLPASEIAVNTFNQLSAWFLPPRLLPKLDFTGRAGVPAEYRTAVVIPTLFPDVASVREALENIEVQYLANREAHLHFAVLSDFTDSDKEHRDSDAEIVQAAVAGVNALNDRYAPDTRDAFYLFHRPRRWNPAQGVWMGWERKRGKLAEFNRFVRTRAREAFSTIVGNEECLYKVRYVITLDADTVLPPEVAPLLIGALAHPLNRAVYDPAKRRVVKGYGILQPRVGVSLPSAHYSLFATIHSGHPGVDPYTTAVSDVYQDLYGEGSFTGKGIYDVEAFEQATNGRFPENKLLSHDLIEGSFARAGLVTDINVYDDYPTRYLPFMRRKHRWIRGDWQLLDWLTRRVPGPGGPERNRLSWLSRWKIFDNLRRSLIEIALLILFVAGWTVLPGSPLRWTLIAVGGLAAPWLVSLLIALLRPPFDKSLGAYYRAVLADTRTSGQQFLLALTLLPHQALVSADAIVRTLWRVLVSKRRLLEWQTASLVEHATSHSAAETWRAMWPAVALSLGLLIGIPAFALADAAEVSPGLTYLALAMVPILGLWLTAPAVAHMLSRPPRRARSDIPEDRRAQGLRYARLHWHFFERFATEKTNGLAPDNFQEDPEPTIALRTSPTNIGLQLLSIVSAHDLGFSSIEDMTLRLEAVFRSLEQMERLRGHFYNWYDLETLRALQPAYVSTVDSGNLAGSLIALRQACIALGNQDTAEASVMRERLTVIADRAYAYVMEMDFGFLYDTERKLFTIGYQATTHSLDSSYYDLLASEARLASFLAIAKSDVPVEHWFHLGRTLTREGGATALVSWSGSMFEYLMPTLLMQTLPFTVLDQTCQAAVERHIAYAGVRAVPWGISESAYAVRDRHHTYQYRAFGVPDLALKHGLDRDLVVAPYASALAIAVSPRGALANLASLEKLGALGDYGFRDSLDYTRPPPRGRYTLVGIYMAHHIGMTLVALTNGLTRNVWHARFHADPLVRSAELLLHERIPRRLVLQEPQPVHVAEVLPDEDTSRPSVREFESPDTPQPHVALLGQSPYTVMVSNSGAGYSQYEELAVTRWRSDATTDHTGQFCYVKDVARGHVWSAAHQPVCAEAEWSRALLATDRVTFQRVDGAIETRTEIALVPADSAEVRRVTVSNNGSETVELELTSYGEVVLAPAAAERAHPAFANLFVETEFHEWCQAITATRRPRSATERSVICVHVAATGDERVGAVTCETDRARFVGRGRSTRDPRVLDVDGDLPGTTGAVLDPIFALRTRVRLAAGQSAKVSFTTLIASTRERAFHLADRYNDPRAAQRAFDLAWASTQVELRELGITPNEAAGFQEVAGHLLYTSHGLGAKPEDRERNRGSQPLLWTIGISGDRPILLATIDSDGGLPTLRQLFTAHHYWRRRGLLVDLVVLNEHAPTYLNELDEEIKSALAASRDGGTEEQPGGVFLRRAHQVAEDALLMLRATARVHIPCDGRSLRRILYSAQVPVTRDEAVAEPATPHSRERRRKSWRVRRTRGAGAGAGQFVTGVPQRRRSDRVEAASAVPLQFDNDYGGLNPQNDYEIRVRGDFGPPAPWSNVIANPHGGFIVTERGAGYMWARNSYFYRITPWQNDPVSDPSGDVLYLRDEDSGELWSATPGPIVTGATHTVRHSAGVSTFAHSHALIDAHLTIGLAEGAAAKLSTLRLTNRSSRVRRLSVTAYVEWTLGVLRDQTQHQVRTWFSEKENALYADNTFDSHYASWAAFCALSEPISAFTADRREFIGRNGTLAAPAALRADQLSGATGAELDPCAALQCQIELQPGETRTIVVLLGAAESQQDAEKTIAELRDVARAAAATQQTVQVWQDRLSVITVKTPDPAFDAMINCWTLYQALCCRMWARSGFYQSSGAYGFRDQLQDVMAFVYAEPAVAREHLLRAAARQFQEGDVQHWWHPDTGRGVRTRFSDDLAWLPYVVEHYTRVTGDTTVLDEQVPFLNMRTLEPGEDEIYDLPQVASESATLYEHCLRALQKACTTGEHGLPLIGTGDWNDGMNRVGREGRGESVWLGWFLATTLRSFATIAKSRGDNGRAGDLEAQAELYVEAVEAHGWDGAWYRRAYFDDGTPLGSSQSDECRIDAIAQSWSVISGAGQPERQTQAMRSLEQYLVREDARIMALLTPPFDRMAHDPGYIKGYLPGVRENGAQYTHAALWTVLATALHGERDRAFELFQMINPLTRTATPRGVETYKVEPYVVAADVYAAKGQLGRGGWTWYTGSASWMYRVGLETILGFRKTGAALTIEPRVPASWREYIIEYRYGASVYRIVVQNEHGAQARSTVVSLDGVALTGGAIPLVDDGSRHEVLVRRLP